MTQPRGVELPSPGSPAMASAKTPVGPGRISVVGVVLALELTVLGLVGVRDALISGNVLTGQSWLEGGVDAMDGMQPQWWLVPAGAVMLLLGLWLLLVALRPRRSTAVALRSETGVFLRPGDVQRLASRAAEDVDGVLSSNVSVTRRAARMSVSVTGNDPSISEQVREIVEDRLAGIDPPPRVKVTSRIGTFR